MAVVEYTNMNEYVPPTLTVDAVIFQLIDSKLNVLLIERASAPFLGELALPGGYCAVGETTTEAWERVVKNKTGLDPKSLDYIEQLYTFDTVARDPRGHAVSVAYMGLGKDLKLETSNDVQSPIFKSANSISKLAYDHHKIVNQAVERLASKLTYTNAVYALLPKKFTLSQLQSAYEAVLNRKLDKRNFRKKYLSLGLVKELDELSQGQAHRPARLYTFKKQSLDTLVRSFD